MSETEASRLLQEIAAGRGVILSCHGLRFLEHSSVSDLEGSISSLKPSPGARKGSSSAEIFGEDSVRDLGDAPAWVDAGEVYEELIATIEGRGPLDFVICVDPWAAQLRSRAGEIAEDARWILIADPEGHRRGGANEGYWEFLDQWFETLSFTMILTEGVWDKVRKNSEQTRSRRTDDPVFLQQPGSWIWRRVSPRQLPPVLFLVRYSGSLGHLRVFLDSLVRQADAGRSFRCVVLSGPVGDDARSYLRWFSIAHDHLSVDLVEITAPSADAWRVKLGQLLASSGSPTLVLLGDHSILPNSFVRTLQEGRVSYARGTLLSSEASAHIITGNLDPITNYDSLLRAHSGAQAEGAEGARVLSPEAWEGPGGDTVSRILSLSQAPPPPVNGPFPHLLGLGDLR
jgi:hypothetical protein